MKEAAVGREQTVIAYGDEALIPANLLAVVELVEKGALERQEHAPLLPLPATGASRSSGSRTASATRSLHGAPVRRIQRTAARVRARAASSRVALLTGAAAVESAPTAHR
jgi:hypothetical protein